MFRSIFVRKTVKTFVIGHYTAPSSESSWPATQNFGGEKWETMIHFFSRWYTLFESVWGGSYDPKLGEMTRVQISPEVFTAHPWKMMVEYGRFMCVYVLLQLVSVQGPC